MKRFFSIYQFVVPIIFFPVGYYLWLLRYQGDHSLVILTLSLPIVFAYVMPGIGTNILQLWEFNTCFRLGKYRPHQGFVYGTAVSLLGLICFDATQEGMSAGSLLRSAFIMGTTLAFWNWLYDMYAIKSGFITLYRVDHYKNTNIETIVTEYAPLLFGSFGICYGIFLHLSQYYLVEVGKRDLYWLFWVGGNLSVLIIPVLAFGLFTYVKYGKSGIQSFFKRRGHAKHNINIS